MFHEITGKIENNQRKIRLQDYSIGAARFPMHVKVKMNVGTDSILFYFSPQIKVNFVWKKENNNNG